MLGLLCGLLFLKFLFPQHLLLNQLVVTTVGLGARISCLHFWLLFLLWFYFLLLLYRLSCSLQRGHLAFRIFLFLEVATGALSA